MRHDPHWQKQREHWMKHRPPHWQRKRRRLFVRFAMVFGLMAGLLFGGLAVLALLFTRAAGGTGETAIFVWIAGCGLALALPLLALGIASRAFRGIAAPLADVMAAADAVAEGDLTVRVPENGRRNQFGQLAHSFNRMTAELERADQRRRNMTADIAHELRTPLHIIRGNLEGILDGVYDPTPDHVEATLEETRTLSRLVDDLHTLSQAEAGQLPLHLEAVDVTELLADVYTSFSGQAEVKDIALIVDFDGKPADLTVTGDAVRLNQVLTNLVSNALRHTPSGGQIQLAAARQNENVCISVRDNGAGIPAADLPYIFDRFWRGDLARTHVDGAHTGLGLAIARQLVEAHQGSINVTSEPGEGACFTILLPAR